jgi:CheY-like chemotaxis protein
VVLIVDDDRDISGILSDVLQEEGYATATVPDGREALRVLREGLRPCVIFLDLMMPGMSGWEFRANQLSDPELSAIPVVVITAGGFAPAAIQSQLPGVGLIRKPLPLDDVLAAIAESCPSPEACPSP